MTRRFGLLAGMILGMMLFIGQASAQRPSVFGRTSTDLSHKLGVQILGGGAYYFMGDVNDYQDLQASNAIPVNGKRTILADDKANLGLAGGLSFIYRTEERVVFTFGYNALGSQKAYLNYEDRSIVDNSLIQEYELEHLISGGEMYIQGDYLFPITDVFNISLGMGPAVYSASLDRTVSSGTSFNDATGRAFGFRGGVSAELLLGETWGLHMMLGGRYARITRLQWDAVGSEITQTEVGGIPKWEGYANRTFQVDFTGFFMELGLRIYFKPSTNWIQL